MTKLFVMTDLHLTAGESIIGLDPCARLTAGLAHAARMHPDAARLILLGDLTHHGRPEQYAELRAVLETAPWPITYLIGACGVSGCFSRRGSRSGRICAIGHRSARSAGHLP